MDIVGIMVGAQVLVRCKIYKASLAGDGDWAMFGHFAQPTSRLVVRV